MQDIKLVEFEYESVSQAPRKKLNHLLEHSGTENAVLVMPHSNTSAFNKMQLQPWVRRITHQLPSIKHLTMLLLGALMVILSIVYFKRRSLPLTNTLYVKLALHVSLLQKKYPSAILKNTYSALQSKYRKLLIRIYRSTNNLTQSLIHHYDQPSKA